MGLKTNNFAISKLIFQILLDSKANQHHFAQGFRFKWPLWLGIAFAWVKQPLFASQHMLSAEVFNLSLWLTPNCIFNAHLCIILLDSHALDGHCMQKWHSQRNSFHLEFCNSNDVQLAKQGLREGKGSKARHSQLPTTWKQSFLDESLVNKQHLRSFCCYIFSLLRDACALEHVQLMSKCFQWAQKLKIMHSWWCKCGLQSLNFQVATLTRQEHVCTIWARIQHHCCIFRLLEVLRSFGDAIYEVSKVLFGVFFWRLCPWNTLETWCFPPVQESKPLKFSCTRENFECWHSWKSEMTLLKGKAGRCKAQTWRKNGCSRDRMPTNSAR